MRKLIKLILLTTVVTWGCSSSKIMYLRTENLPDSTYAMQMEGMGKKKLVIEKKNGEIIEIGDPRHATYSITKDGVKMIIPTNGSYFMGRQAFWRGNPLPSLGDYDIRNKLDPPRE